MGYGPAGRAHEASTTRSTPDGHETPPDKAASVGCDRLTKVLRMRISYRGAVYVVHRSRRVPVLRWWRSSSDCGGLRGGVTSSAKAWRYMSFGRFVWMLKKKALWLTRVDRLEDAWEGLFSEKELHAIVEASTSGVRSRTRMTDADMADLRRKLSDAARAQRERFFVNCWRASKSESHAMWSIYCSSKEGVAIQTTLSKLQESVGDLEIVPVKYLEFGSGRNPSGTIPRDLVTRSEDHSPTNGNGEL